MFHVTAYASPCHTPDKAVEKLRKALIFFKGTQKTKKKQK